jgi:hypothetical protein
MIPVFLANNPTSVNMDKCACMRSRTHTHTHQALLLCTLSLHHLCLLFQMIAYLTFYEACKTNSFEDADGWRYCNRKNHHRCLDNFHWCTCWHLLFAKNSLGSCLNHCIAASCTSLSDMNAQNLRTFFKSKHVKITWLYAQYLITCHCMAFNWAI